MEAWNETIFLALNASEHPSHAMILLAIAFAQWAVFFVPALLAALWLWGDRESRAGLLLAVIAAEAALAFS